MLLRDKLPVKINVSEFFFQLYLGFCCGALSALQVKTVPAVPFFGFLQLFVSA